MRKLPRNWGSDLTQRISLTQVKGSYSIQEPLRTSFPPVRSPRLGKLAFPLFSESLAAIPNQNLGCKNLIPTTLNSAPKNLDSAMAA